MKSKEDKIYDFIVNNNLATKQEIELVCSICGWTVETLNKIVYCRTEYHDPGQCLACEPTHFIDVDEDFES